MTDLTPVELLTHWSRNGTRSFEEAQQLLKAWNFAVRTTKKGHAICIHPRGVTLTITRTKDLRPAYKAQILRAIRQLQLRDG